MPTISNNTNAGFPGVFIELWGDSADMVNMDYAMAADKVGASYDRRGATDFFNIGFNLNQTLTDTITNGTNDLAIVDFWAEKRDGQYLVQIAIDSPDSSQYRFGLLSTGNGAFDTWSAEWLGHNDMIDTIPTVTEFPPITNYVLPDTMQSMVSSWACSPKVITTANYYNNQTYVDYSGTLQSFPPTEGAISVTSSKGPTRDNSLKPDIGATGDLTLSAGSLGLLSFYQTNYPSYLDQGGMHVRNGGTSMASPVVAGVAALYLEKCPKGTPQHFKDAITNTARQDGFTGATPNYVFGYGKVDGFEALTYTNDQAIVIGDSIICGSDSLYIQTNATFDSLLWSNGLNTEGFYITQADTFSFTTINAHGCKTWSDTLITVNETKPSKPSISIIGNDTLITNSYAGYQWYLDNAPVSGGTYQLYEASQSGYYFVEVDSSNGCSSLSDTIFVSVTAILELEGSISSIYPNPTSGELSMSFETAPDQVEIFDPAGKLVEEWSLKSQKTVRFNLSGMMPGVYQIRVRFEDRVESSRIILQY